jgi:hypothetical protein
MKQIPLKGRTTAWGAGFFIYGMLVHLLFLRYFVRWAYSGADTTFVNHPLTNIGVPILGGICFSFLELRLLKKATESETMTAQRVVLEGGLRAMGATILALEIFYVLASAYLAALPFEVREANQPPAPERIGGAFILWFVSIQVYGLQPVVLSLPVSFASGCIAAVPILWVTNKRFGRTVGTQ